MPDIHYYYAISDEDNFNQPIRGYSSSGDSAYFHYVGVQKDVNPYDANGLITSRFANLTDLITSLEIPKPINDADPETRNVILDKGASAIKHSFANGIFKAESQVEYMFAIDDGLDK